MSGFWSHHHMGNVQSTVYQPPLFQLSLPLYHCKVKLFQLYCFPRGKIMVCLFWHFHGESQKWHRLEELKQYSKWGTFQPSVFLNMSQWPNVRDTDWFRDIYFEWVFFQVFKASYLIISIDKIKSRMGWIKEMLEIVNAVGGKLKNNLPDK